ncbi:MAG: apolipoprotein N-acyltransferase [Desulfobacterales bacterium]|nr:apolipoprotein N-acyltransferase [Desulfobacterales bacterium]
MKVRILFSIVSGLLLTVSFPNFYYSYCIWFSLVPLLVSLRGASLSHSFCLGFLTGLTHYFSFLYWATYTLKTYVQFPLYLCIFIYSALCIYLSIYIGLFAVLTSRLCFKPLRLLFILPIVWVSFEYARTILLFSGFPWGLLGYSQFKQLYLIQFVDITGVYGLSFLIIQANVVIFIFLLHVTKKKWNGVIVKKNILVCSTLGFIIILGIVILYGKVRVDTLSNLSSVKAAVIQGNIEQSMKWNPLYRSITINKYIKLSQDTKSDLIIWPETSVPFYFKEETTRSRPIIRAIREIKADFLIGSPSINYEKDAVKYYNSAYLVNKDGRILDQYNKIHLVPFGEYIPWKILFSSIKKFTGGAEDFNIGTKIEPILWTPYKIGVQICYEVIFPNLARGMAKNGAQFFVNITNDAWFGKTSAPYQHFYMALFRAVENKRALIRSANTGISGFIDPVGRIMAYSPIFEEAVLANTIPINNQITFYTRFGDLFVFLNILLLAIIIIFDQFLNHRVCLRIQGKNHE